jgi:signal transduction histidine kinase
MQLTFRAKLLAGQVALVAVVVGLVMIELDRSLAHDLEAQLQERLEAQAAGASQWVKQNRHPDKLVSRLAAVVGARVSLFSASGAPIADSHPQADAEAPSEIAAAVNGSVGRAVRADASGQSVAYVAVPTDESIVRLSLPLATIDATIADMRKRLLFASLLALVAAMGLGVLASRVAARPLRAMTRAADRIARGEYNVDLPPRTPDDFGVLSDALGSLAARLSSDMARIQRLERVRRDFIANVSHELRTPVTTIQGYAETLLDGEHDAESRREFTEAIHRHALRLGALTAQLLRLSELEARPPEDELVEPVDVGAIAEHVVQGARTRADGVAIEAKLGGELLALGDPLSVEQVLDNLIDNAIKHGAEGKLVRVEGKRHNGEVIVRVIDRGRGIPEEHLPRIFERFYRIDPSRSRAQGGAGLGLAIVKHLCESMGGRVSVTSADETCFEVRLPAA